MKDLKILLTDISKTARPEFRALREALKKGIEKGFIGRDFELREINTGANLFKKSGEALLALSTSYRNKYLSQLQHAFYMIILIELRSSILIKISTGLFIHTPLSHEMQRQLSSRPILRENNTVSPASQNDIDKFYFLQVLYAFITVPRKNTTLRKHFWLEMPEKTNRMNRFYKDHVIYLHSRKINRIISLCILIFLMIAGSTLYTFYLKASEDNSNPYLPSTTTPLFKTANTDQNSNPNESLESYITFSQLYKTTYLVFSVILTPIIFLLFIFTALLCYDLHQINYKTQFAINILIQTLIERWAEKFSEADRDFLNDLSTYNSGIDDASTLVELEERLYAIVEKPGFTLSTNPMPLPAAPTPPLLTTPTPV